MESIHNAEYVYACYGIVIGIGAIYLASIYLRLSSVRKQRKELQLQSKEQ